MSGGASSSWRMTLVAVACLAFAVFAAVLLPGGIATAVTTPVLVSADNSQAIALQLDAAGIPVVAYYESAQGHFYLVHCGNPDCSTGNVSTLLDPTVGTGSEFSMVLDQAGDPVIAYMNWDASQGYLRFIHCGDPNCASKPSKVLDTVANDLIRSPGLRLDGSGRPMVVYGAARELRLLTCDDADCATVNPPTVVAVGISVSTGGTLALDSSEFGVIAYAGGVLHCHDRACATRSSYVLAMAGNPQIALDVSGRPIVAFGYQDQVDYRYTLRVLACGDVNCASGNVVTPADAEVEAGYRPSLALDTSGNPVISYDALTRRVLKIAHCLDHACTSATITTPDLKGPTGAFSSIQLDARGNPVIAYNSATGVRLLHCDNTTCNDHRVFGWRQAHPATQPPARNAAQMAYDELHQRIVLFGGADGSAQYRADTWTWDGSTWTQRQPSTSPSGRAAGAMAYDPVSQRVILFGGNHGADIDNETWAWDGSNWTHLQPVHSPSARSSFTMAGTENGIILFGGFGRAPCPNLCNDTWLWNGTDWIEQHPATVPPERQAAAMTYDWNRRYAVLFGGVNGSGLLNDTWLWGGTDWFQSWSAVTFPAARAGAQMAFDRAQGVAIMTAGSAGYSHFSETWAWDGSNWQQVAPPSAWPFRFYPAMAYDAARENVVLFGGYTSPPDAFWQETWLWAGRYRSLTMPVSVQRPANGFWYTQGGASAWWGVPGDIPVPGDYDGDGLLDRAVYRPSTGYWYVVNSKDSSVATTWWGVPGDVPLQGDFDGDGKADIAVFRQSNGYWYIINSNGGAVTTTWWGMPGDRPVVGDYDGDGRSDLAVFRPSNGFWYVTNSHDGSVSANWWGMPGDVPIPGDYDGDGKTDLAVLRTSNGYWYVLNSHNGSVSANWWAMPGDIPEPGDYDGDGVTDRAVYRPSNGYWYIVNSHDGSVTATWWGMPGDIPLSLPYISRQTFSLLAPLGRP